MGIPLSKVLRAAPSPVADEINDSTAIQAVFDIHELAEQIFLELSFCDILINVQRTCKQWRTHIDASTKLQETLFFKPIPGPPLVFDDSDQKPLPLWQNIFEHPMMCMILIPEKQKYFSNEYREASWRRQLVTQPPTIGLQLMAGGKMVQHTGDVTYMGDLFEGRETGRIAKGIVGWTIWRTSNWTYDSTYHVCITLAKEELGWGPWRALRSDEEEEKAHKRYDSQSHQVLENVSFDNR